LDAAEIKSYIQANITWASNPPITDLKTVWDLYMMAIWESRSIEKLKVCEWGKKNPNVINLVEKFDFSNTI
jgi:hypothetical protein